MTIEQPYLFPEEEILNTENKMYTSEFYFTNCIPLIDLIETYQGEGSNCGKKMVLARFKYCNKHCPFCDTWSMMKDTQTKFYSLKEIQMKLKNSPSLMITGGEPTLENKVSENSIELSQMNCTVAMATYLNYRNLDIETNGFQLHKLAKAVNYIVKNNNKQINISWSPKFISDSDYAENIKNITDSFNKSDCEYAGLQNVTMKVVIGEDMEQYKRFIYQAVLDYGWDSNKLYLMPKGTTLDEINKSMDMVLSVASDLSCNVSSRLHIIHNFK